MSARRKVSSNQLADLNSAFGDWMRALVVALESMGIPAPGETALVSDAILDDEAAAIER